MSARIVGRPPIITPNPVRKRRPDAPELIAYRVSGEPMKIVPAFANRDWMEKTPERFANRCLPLRMSNQSGWMCLNPTRFTAVWNGGAGIDAITITREGPNSVASHFGSAVLTFSLPWMFRTANGWNTQLRGPPNWPKDAIQACEGIIETDWLDATATMNWLFTAENEPVTFEVDEPIAMVVPVRRGDLELFAPKIIDVSKAPEVGIPYERWLKSRTKFNSDLKVPNSEAVKQKWQRDYMLGRMSNGSKFEAHQTKLNLKEFMEEK